MADGIVPIPQPPGLPFLGNVTSIDPQHPLASLGRLADQYGPIFRLNLGGKMVTFLASWELVNEACDETRFAKSVGNVLAVSGGTTYSSLSRLGERYTHDRAGDPEWRARWPLYRKPCVPTPFALCRRLTWPRSLQATMDEPNWGIAHRVLMPAFGPMSIKGMFDEMHDLAGQLALKWAREGPSAPIMESDDFSRLTLDALALCAMNYRFYSFYHDEMHPFIKAMGDYLKESGARARRPFPAFFYRKADQKYWEDIEILRKTADDVLQERKQHPSGRKDLLAAMLEGVDPKTGQKMSDSSITDNLITFLIAGHETTSGLLSFAFYHLLKPPDAYRRAQQEVDEVVGSGPITAEHLGKLRFLAAVCCHPRPARSNLKPV